MPALSPLLLLPPVPGSRLHGGLQVGTNMGLGTSYLSATLDLTAQRGARVVSTAKGCGQALCEPLTQPAHLGEALSKNPGYIKLRKIRAAQNISKTVSPTFPARQP